MNAGGIHHLKKSFLEVVLFAVVLHHHLLQNCCTSVSSNSATKNSLLNSLLSYFVFGQILALSGVTCILTSIIYCCLNRYNQNKNCIVKIRLLTVLFVNSHKCMCTMHSYLIFYVLWHFG